MEFLPLPAGFYSESQVLQFIGWLSSDIKELHYVEVPKLADSWERFKAVFDKERAAETEGKQP